MDKPLPTVLIAEDDSTTCAEIQRYLAPAYTCVLAPTAEAVRGFCRTGLPDALVLSARLPDGDALTLMSELLDMYGEHACPIVVLLHADEPATNARALKLGAYDCLVFPRDLPFLRRIIAAARAQIERGEPQMPPMLDHVVLDSLGAHVAVLGRDGRLLAVNAAWRRFALAGGLTYEQALACTDVGVNYLAVCLASAATGDADAATTYAGLRAVLDGTRTSFSVEYPCHGPQGKQWFLMHATPLARPDGGAVVVHTDVTARVEAEQALAQREAQIAGIIDSAMDAIVTLDADQRIVGWNVAAERMFGCPAADALGQPHECFLPHRYRANHAALVGIFGATGATSRTMGLHSQLTALRADGAEFPIEASISAIIVGDTTLYTAIVRDITMRRRAEAALRESEANYRTLFETMYEGFSVQELIRDEAGVVVDTRYLLFNPAHERHTGLKVDDMIGKRRSEIFPNNHDFSRYQRVVDTGTPERFEQYASSINRWYNVTFFPYGPDRLAILYDDITERKLADEARRRSEERFTQAFQASPVAIVISTQEEGRIVDANSRFLELTAYRMEDVIGKTSSELDLWINPADRSQLVEQFRREGSLRDRDMQIRSQPGEIHDVLISVEQIELDGEREYLLTLMHDISERKRAEQALMASRQQLLEMTAQLVNAQEDERRALAYELHDEIGQQLTALNIGLEIDGNMSIDDMRARLREAQQLVAELTGQVRQLSLDLRPPMLDELGLPAALGWYIERFRRQTSIVVDYKYSGIDAGLPATVAITAYRIVQEGLTNIARYAGVAAATVRVWRRAGWLHLTVEDRGRGFDPATLPRIAQSAGLAGMRERARLLGGRFDLDSTPGEGTRIYVTLPLAPGLMNEVEGRL